MEAPPSQTWDFGAAVASLFQFFWKQFEDCGLGHGSETDNDEHAEKLSATGAIERRRSATSGNTQGVSGSSSGGGGGRIAKARHEPRTVRFDHAVDVRADWQQHLSPPNEEEAPTGRARAATMVDGDEFSCIVKASPIMEASPITEASHIMEASPIEEASPIAEASPVVETSPIVKAAPDAGLRKAVREPPRKLSRAARLAAEGDGENAFACVGMKLIVASGRAAVNGAREDEDIDGDEDEEGYSGLFAGYDGSLESLKALKFPSTNRSSRRSIGRPAKKIFRAATLASSSPAQRMTSADIEAIIGRTRGWKEGSCGNSAGRRRRRKNNVDHSCGGGRVDSGNEVFRGEMSRVSADNSGLKEELFALALAEHRTSLLFKRAFLNWERSSERV